MFSSNYGPYSLHVISNFSLLVPARNVSRLCQMVFWRENCPWTITTLQGHYDPAATLLSIAWYQVNCLLWNLPLISCKYFMMLSRMRFPDLNAVLLDIISLSLATGKVPKQFKNNLFRCGWKYCLQIWDLIDYPLKAQHFPIVSNFLGLH